MSIGQGSLRILVAEAGDTAAAVDCESDVSRKIVDILAQKYPGASVDLLSEALKAQLPGGNLREHIAGLVGSVREYELIIAYVPEPHMLNALLIWSAQEHGVPVVVVSKCRHTVLGLAGDVICDLASLADRLPAKVR